MKNWFNNKPRLAIIAILLLTAFIYRDSFASRFFQDDKLNLELAASHDFLALIPGANHFRPLSVQGFYLLGKTLFGLDPLGYHLVEFVIFSATLLLIFKAAKLITSSEKQSLIVTFLYAINISLFANFFWIANSQFVIGSFFFFLCIHLFNSSKKTAWLTVPAFLLGLISNEQILALLLVLPATSFFWKKQFFWFIFAVIVAAGIFWVWLKIFIFGLPTTSDYAINLNPIVGVSTLRWYILRALNLPEAVKLTNDWFFTGAFGLFLLALMKPRPRWKWIIFGAAWFNVTLGIFMFLPKHMSAHYLSVALFGSSLVLSELLPRNKLLLVGALVLYLFLTISGLNFLSETHWVILKNTGPIGKF